MSKIKTILLVCTGNSCRSVMAWGMLKQILKDKGDYKIITAGISAIEGMQPTLQTIQVMSEKGIDVSSHRSSLLTDEMLKAADLILVMEARHKENILGRAPQSQNKVHLLREFGRIRKENELFIPDIPDPIGKSIDFYRKVSDIIKESIERVAKKLTEEL